MIDVEEILSKMNLNQKINYDRVMQKMVRVWEKDQKRPTILMHTCCAPCSTYTLEYLSQYADVTICISIRSLAPTKSISASGKRFFISSAIAMAGNICPPVPPPEIINFFIQFSYLVLSSITVISGHTPKRPGKA